MLGYDVDPWPGCKAPSSWLQRKGGGRGGPGYLVTKI